jgi:hypothetical protein
MKHAILDCLHMVMFVSINLGETTKAFKAYGREKVGKGTLHPPEIVVTNTTFLHLVFLCKYKHHILDFFVYLKYIGLDLDLRQSFEKKTPTNIGELQHMKHIGDEIILITKYEILHTYFKTRVVGGIFW